jgi:predicted membrane protein
MHRHFHGITTPLALPGSVTGCVLARERIERRSGMTGTFALASLPVIV